MNLDELNRTIQEINNFIKNQDWFDFEVKQYVGNELVVQGGLSLTYPDIEIIFRDIFLTSLPMEWKTDTSGTVLTILEGDEEKKINEEFQVEYLHHIFKFTPEDYPSNFGCIIAAKHVSYNILKP
ncbi:hypothetical protein JOE49_004909 [Paenibacillus sp. PvR133]|jgi:hypothetical protein|uniref:hypothetical protein n=1 Tax=Paenibacillus sp. PvR133 TaxID=2806598 RepID=UPI001AE45D7E|nr:hypothetical protein [Paenibacillus sp. PvR133]MBP1177657.1 hypothetical protein [Paenibacillus sp. PvR133]